MFQPSRLLGHPPKAQIVTDRKISRACGACIHGRGGETWGQGAETKTDGDAIIELAGNNLVEKSADQLGKSSIDKQETNPTQDSKDKSSKKKS